MQVSELQAAIGRLAPDISANKSANDATTSFGEMLDGFVNHVNDLQNSANTAMDKMASGQPADVNEVMVAMEKAKVSFDMLLQIRNKMLDAYKQIMQMQM
jgi:flagellar hook-basal body complex protein FliE